MLKDMFDTDDPNFDPKQVFPRIKWHTNNCLRVINEEGFEKLVEFERHPKEVIMREKGKCVIPMANKL